MNIQRTSRLFLLGILLTLFSLVEARAAVMQSDRAYAFSMPAEWRYASESVATLMHQRTGVKLTLAHADSAMLKIVHDAALGSEAYTLQIADNDIVVRAASVKGVNWAMAQLAQLLSAAGGQTVRVCYAKEQSAI
jgi:N-acetyl-beta-hexosaminidase